LLAQKESRQPVFQEEAMAERWDERDRGNWRDERSYRGPEQDRGMVNRSADEVRSWFGDEDAARRRRMDEARDRDDRDWDHRTSNTAERAWDRTRETARDLTDKDRDGRRGFAEWNDNDRPGDRYRSSAYGAPAARGGDEYWTRDRPYRERGGYAGADSYEPYIGSRWNTTVPSTANYVGRGPRGYRRGDERIREDVCDRLTDDPRIDASDVDVQVKDAEVTLAGSVRTREEKRFAEDVIERISGVRDVNNNLKVKPADEVIGTARRGASVLGLTDTPPPTPGKSKLLRPSAGQPH
jgi:osmotically-inducible protein OsmY